MFHLHRKLHYVSAGPITALSWLHRLGHSAVCSGKEFSFSCENIGKITMDPETLGVSLIWDENLHTLVRNDS